MSGYVNFTRLCVNCIPFNAELNRLLFNSI